MTVPMLREFVAKAARCLRYDGRAKKEVEVAPPADLAVQIINRAGFWVFPILAGIITTPTLRPNGSLLATAGYDPATRLYLLNPPSMPPVPERPTMEDASAALALLTDLLDGFPFVTSADRAVALSALLTPLMRSAMPVVPMHAASAPAAGTGKSYLFDVAAAIASGSLCPVIALSDKAQETESRLGAAALAGKPILSIDNVSAPLQGDFLCQLVERPVIEVRELGLSRLHTIENRMTIFATGNNLRITRDMTRRALLCRLDADCEHPEERQFTTAPVRLVQADRGRYVAVVLTIVRAYLAAGMPGRLPALASFEQWSDLVRSPLVWLGCADPVETMGTPRADDPDAAAFTTLLDAWPSGPGDQTSYSTAELVEAAQTMVGGEPARPALLEALLTVTRNRRGLLDATTLGYWLREHKDAIAAGRKLVRVGSATHGRWAVKASWDSNEGSDG
jgi:putative DNA primase/helicase